MNPGFSTEKIAYRTASLKDVPLIAQLHAQSWQQNYRNNFSDAYLNGPVIKDRQEVWQARFEKSNPKQHVILAEVDQQLCGFLCLFLDEDEQYGTLIDNLHVSSDFQKKGIGKTLMLQAKAYLQERAKSQQYFLYVLTDNLSAINFYQKIGGQMKGIKLFDNPDGNQSETLRIAWGQ